MLHSIILHPSTSFALAVPCHLSSDCGTCLCIPWEEREVIFALLEKEKVKIGEIHSLTFEKN